MTSGLLIFWNIHFPRLLDWILVELQLHACVLLFVREIRVRADSRRRIFTALVASILVLFHVIVALLYYFVHIMYYINNTI